MKNIQDIIDHYDGGVEQARLQKGGFQIERIRTQELISRYLPEGKAVIADIGGGAGAYSFWLSESGHEVHFLDVSPGNVAYVRGLNEVGAAKLASIQPGDARTLPYKDNSFDAVLLLGPMYHLIDPDERQMAIRESYRVLKKGGILLTATISRFASMFDGFFSNLVEDPEFVPIMMEDLKTGIHVNPTARDYFTSAYFQTPESISAELEMIGYAAVKWHSVDGFGWMLPDIDDKLKDPGYTRLLLDVLRHAETEKSLAGISAHHLTIGYKQT